MEREQRQGQADDSRDANGHQHDVRFVPNAHHAQHERLSHGEHAEKDVVHGHRAAHVLEAAQRQHGEDHHAHCDPEQLGVPDHIVACRLVEHEHRNRTESSAELHLGGTNGGIQPSLRYMPTGIISLHVEIVLLTQRIEYTLLMNRLRMSASSNSDAGESSIWKLAVIYYLFKF